MLHLRVSSWVGRRPVVAIALVEHMGDIMAAEPLSRRARQMFPNARILWFVRHPYATLVQHYPALVKTVPVTCLTEWLLLRDGIGADVVWDLHLTGRTCPQCGIPVERHGEAQTLTFENYYRRGSLLTVQSLCAGLDPIDQTPALELDEAVARSVTDLGLQARFVAIHCASNEAIRDWPREKWAALLEHISGQLGLHVVELGLAARVVERDTSRSRSLCGLLSIMQTAEVIRRAALFIGVDSGPAHIANAVGTEGVILLGRYRNFVGQMPYSGRYADGTAATIVRADGPVATLSVDQVIEAVDARLSLARSRFPSDDPAGLAATNAFP